jgi:hypothetical protein
MVQLERSATTAPVKAKATKRKTAAKTAKSAAKA